mgnify:CR=1 FL=1
MTDRSNETDEILDRAAAEIAAAGGHNLLMIGPPGAGKTTRVPLALLGEPWLAGRSILMLEPRRLAARAAAVTSSSVASSLP